MRTGFLLIFTVLLLSCKSNKELDSSTDTSNLTINEVEDPMSSKRVTAENFSWLVGNWLRIDDKAGEQTYENWTRFSDAEYRGVSYTRTDDKEIWREAIYLKVTPESSQYIVSLSNEKPTYFKITNIRDKSFKAENHYNPFPQVIEYKIVADTLKATISGSGRVPIPFTFIKAKQK